MSEQQIPFKFTFTKTAPLNESHSSFVLGLAIPVCLYRDDPDLDDLAVAVAISLTSLRKPSVTRQIALGLQEYLIKLKDAPTQPEDFHLQMEAPQ